MRVGYIECFAGISGDMLLGALVDAGVSKEVLENAAAALSIGAELRFASVNRSGVQATKADVLVDGHLAEQGETPGHTHEHHGHSHHDAHKKGHTHGRNWRQIRTLIERAKLSDEVRRLALRTFELLAHAEAKIHNVPVETVHFHEVGGVDTIADIVCGAAGLCSLEVEAWFCSQLNMGGGFVECEHGKFPVPAPATAELLKGVPTYSSGIQMELVTPTGAALLRALRCSFGDAPAMTASNIGYGAGTRNPERFPNVLRVNIGQSEKSPERTAVSPDRVAVLECALDDTTPQVIAHVMELALAQGALDVMCVPAIMKKGRMGSLLTVLARPAHAGQMQELLLRETTTLGLRMREEDRVILERGFTTVKTAYGPIRIKTGSLADRLLNAMPEYEDCSQAAQSSGVPLKLVMQAALAAFYEAKAEA